MATKKTTNGTKKPAAKAKKPTASAAAAKTDDVKHISAATDPKDIDPNVAQKVVELRAALRENFGKAVMAMMMVPRYRAQTLNDLQHLILDPMLSDRIAFAYPGQKDSPIAPDMAGFAIWASVSEEVDTRIREQISNGVFPIRLKVEEWKSGEINWLLDVIAPDAKTVSSVIANFRSVAKEGNLRLHPLISRLVDPETLEKMGAKKATDEKAGS